MLAMIDTVDDVAFNRKIHRVVVVVAAYQANSSDDRCRTKIHDIVWRELCSRGNLKKKKSEHE